jgi:plasmid stability protein
MNRSNAEKTTMRLPDDVVSWLKAKAAHHVSSMTTEAVRAIRAQIVQEQRERAAG